MSNHGRAGWSVGGPSLKIIQNSTGGGRANDPISRIANY